MRAATPANIALLALEPDARKRSMKITAEAKTSDDMIAYVEQLKQQECSARCAGAPRDQRARSEPADPLPARRPVERAMKTPPRFDAAPALWLPRAVRWRAPGGAVPGRRAGAGLAAAANAPCKASAPGRAGLAALPPPKPLAVAAPESVSRNENLALFYDGLGERRYAEQQVKTLFGLASKAGLVLSQGEYKGGSTSNGRFHTYQVNLPVKGSYGAIWQFGMLALRAIPFASLDEISFRRDSIGEPAVEARLRLTLYLADQPPGGPNEAAPHRPRRRLAGGAGFAIFGDKARMAPWWSRPSAASPRAPARARRRRAAAAKPDDTVIVMRLQPRDRSALEGSSTPTWCSAARTGPRRRRRHPRRRRHRRRARRRCLSPTSASRRRRRVGSLPRARQRTRSCTRRW
jgi:hypothetical protein